MAGMECNQALPVSASPALRRVDPRLLSIDPTATLLWVTVFSRIPVEGGSTMATVTPGVCRIRIEPAKKTAEVAFGEPSAMTETTAARVDERSDPTATIGRGAGDATAAMEANRTFGIV